MVSGASDRSHQADAPPLLRMTGISKSFPGVKAVDDVAFVVRRGEIHALLGENGAGKSTLLKILAGAQPPDAGTIELEGERVFILAPAQLIYDVARSSLEKGRKCHFAANSSVTAGTGGKGIKMPDDWQEVVDEFLNFGRENYG